MSSEFQKKRRKRVGLKTSQKSNGCRFCKFGKRYTPTDSKRQTNPTWDKPKGIHHMVMKLLKTKYKGKNLESIKREMTPSLHRKKYSNNRFTIRNHRGQKELAQLEKLNNFEKKILQKKLFYLISRLIIELLQ